MNQPLPLASNECSPTSQLSAGSVLDQRAALRMAAVGTTAAVAAAGILPGMARATPPTGELGRVLGRRTSGDSTYKQRAVADYHQNMREFGGRMSASSQRLLQGYLRGVPWQFDVLIIGSGYGASISAARIAEQLNRGCRLGLLERFIRC